MIATFILALHSFVHIFLIPFDMFVDCIIRYILIDVFVSEQLSDMNGKQKT